jgi:hypothetical protein
LTHTHGSAECSITTSLGVTVVTDLKTLNPGVGIDNQENLFRVYGACKVYELSAYVQSVTSTVTFDNVEFRAASAGGTVAITAVNAAGGRGITAGALIARTDLSGVATTIIDNSASVIVQDPALAVVYSPFFIIEQTGSIESNILIEYDADAATDLDITAQITYSPLDGTGYIVAV